MLYNVDAPGDWGYSLVPSQDKFATEMLTMADGCRLFLRSWQTPGQDVLLIMHGLGGHSGWYIDMGNELATRGLSIYAVDHRGFGRSEGLAGHIERADYYIDDLVIVLKELRRRHSTETSLPRLYVLGHSMGGIFATYLAAQYGELLDGVLFLNPWVQDTSRPSLRMALGVISGGLVGSQHYWSTPGGPAQMTTNPEAILMLETDPYWRRKLTASFLWQILRMRLQILKQARKVTIPALIMQAEQDRSVVPAASRKLYETLGSHDKTWKVYSDYAHDTQLEASRSQLDQDIVKWIQAHAATQ